MSISLLLTKGASSAATSAWSCSWLGTAILSSISYFYFPNFLDVEALDGDWALGDLFVSSKNFEGSWLSSAVHSQQRKALTLLQPKRKLLNRTQRLSWLHVHLPQILNLQLIFLPVNPLRLCFHILIKLTQRKRRELPLMACQKPLLYLFLYAQLNAYQYQRPENKMYSQRYHVTIHILQCPRIWVQVFALS